MDDPKVESRAERAWTTTAAWIGGITLVLGFFGTLSGTFSKIKGHFDEGPEIRAGMDLAQSQLQQGEYPEASATYTAILQAHPGYRPAADARLRLMERWVENFHVYEQDGKSTAASASSLLDGIIPVLDRALVSAKGTDKADVQAHLGWAHWLNRHIAQREFGPAAEQDLRAALAADPENVYANAMLGNYILQNDGELAEAVQHLDAAVRTGKERPLVRRFQIGGLTSTEEPGARRTLFQALNQMRKDGEPMPPDHTHNVLGFCCWPGINTDDELAETLTSVPRDEALQTFTWLESGFKEDATQKDLKREFIAARLAELAGERENALAQYRKLQANLKGQGMTMDEDVQRAIARLR